MSFERVNKTLNNSPVPAGDEQSLFVHYTSLPQIEPKFRKPKNTTIIQPKITVGAPDDSYEKEADAVADQVMRMPDPAFVERKTAGLKTPSLYKDKLKRKRSLFK